MSFYDVEFKRKFSLNMCKTLTLELAKMTFTSDFYDGIRGDLYPVIEKGGEPVEKIASGILTHSGAISDYTSRFFTQFFPYASYEMTILSLEGEIGFCFFGSLKAKITFKSISDKYCAVFTSGDITEEAEIRREDDCNLTPVISLRPGAFELYIRRKWGIEYITTFKADEFKSSAKDEIFKSLGVSLDMRGDVACAEVRSYMDSGLGLADMRSVRYENGEVLVQHGKMYFTASIRRRWGTHQGVFSWIPGTSEFSLVGCLFFDSGDGVWADDVATSLIFNRMDSKWHLHVASFYHGHIVGGTSFESDVRFGVNVVDINLMTPMEKNDGSEDDLFLGKKGDEDPDLIYDEKRGKWLFSVCRKSSLTLKYKYFFFESDYPDRDFVLVGHGIDDGEETGGSIMPIDGEIYFICGNSRKIRSDYRVYKWGDFSHFKNIKFDYPDGGFRGWGTILPIKIGTRERLFHMTFDRVRTSEYEWSYGNMYVFESESKRLK